MIEEERKVLEEKKHRIETEYIEKKNYYESEFKECISKGLLSQEEQQDCYLRKNHNLDLIKIKKNKELEEAQNYFDEQIALQCSICLEEMDCADDIKVLPCLHEFHYQCVQDVFENTPMSYRCPLCRKPCNIDLEDPINLESNVIMRNRRLFDLPSYDMPIRIFCKQLLAKKQGNLSFCSLKESL